MEVDVAPLYKPYEPRQAFEQQEQGCQPHGQIQQPTKDWAATGSINPKWVSPQRSAWNTPIQPSPEVSPVDRLPMYFPSL